ncbi:MAG: hypothetical protein OEM26_01855 [Saprospiraceae bacterium]|nr:hypothetical protein [Saprospiraceae bacterium]
MKKWIKFIGITLWIVGTRAYDAYSTYQYAPDLTLENNPLVSWLGLGWTPLLIVIGSLLLYIIYAIYISIFRSFCFEPAEPRLGFVRFATYLYRGCDQHWTTIFYKFPTSAGRFHHYMGHVLGRALVLAGIVSTLMWWAFGIRHGINQCTVQDSSM